MSSSETLVQTTKLHGVTSHKITFSESTAKITSKSQFISSK